MSDLFSPRIDILTPPQRRLWDELAGLPPEFLLYRGTAIALHLGHRQSIDFDFFSGKPLDPGRLMLDISFLNGATVIQREPNTLTCLLWRDGPVKVSFFGVPRLPRLRPAVLAMDIGLCVASLHDLGGTKASVVQLRAESKDYIDLDALLGDGRIDLPMALTCARALYGEAFNPQITLKALSYFGDGDLAGLPDDVRSRLARAARAVDLDRLPALGARQPGSQA